MREGFWNNDLRRWLGSFLIVAGLHFGAFSAWFYWPSPASVPSRESMAAMVIELAPVPVAPPVPTVAAPPGELQEEVLPAPAPEPVPDLSETIPELPQVPSAEATLAATPEPVEKKAEKKPEPRPVPESESQPTPQPASQQQEQAPPAVEAPPDSVAAAPEQGAVSLVPSQAAISWQSAVLGHLERHKRYPRESRRRRQQAIVYVRVRINRDGTVVDYRLEQPSRYQPLNQESLTLIARAQPLPPPPADVEGEPVEFVVPVEYSLRR